MTLTEFVLSFLHVDHGLQVYRFFFLVYWTSVISGFLGYFLLVLELIGIGSLLRPVLSPSACIQLLWYGLYFGILGRDCAEVVSDTLVSLSSWIVDQGLELQLN